MSDEVRFAHPSERQFAEILDFYGVRWDYEPVEFVLGWNDDGSPARAFRPDFYLPDHDCFVEITMLSQRLVTKKHAKLRTMAALYPEVTVKLLYQRDICALQTRFGLDEGSTSAA